MKNVRDELKALIQEFSDKPFVQHNELQESKDEVERLLRRFGLIDIPFELKKIKKLLHHVSFPEYDILMNVRIQKEKKNGMLGDNVGYSYSLEAIESYTDKKDRLLALIEKYKDDDFADEYFFKEAKDALRILLDQNNLNDVIFEMKEIHARNCRGDIEEEHQVTFPQFGIMTPLTIDTHQVMSRGERDDVYHYSFKEEEKYVYTPQPESEYNLTFYDAVGACLNGEGFIRGENFKAGIYGRSKDDTLVLVDGADYHKVMFNMMIYKDALRQRYKLFSVALPSEIGLVQNKEG